MRAIVCALATVSGLVGLLDALDSAEALDSDFEAHGRQPHSNWVSENPQHFAAGNAGLQVHVIHMPQVCGTLSKVITVQGIN